MSGMAILLLITVQVDNSGWRSTPSRYGATPAPTTAQPPLGTSGTSGSVNELVDRAQRAMSDGVESAMGFLDSSTGSAGQPPAQPFTQPPAQSSTHSMSPAGHSHGAAPPVSASSVNGASASGSALGAIDRSFEQPANPSTHIAPTNDDTLRTRIRSPSGSAVPPPPPSGAATAFPGAASAGPNPHGATGASSSSSMEGWLQRSRSGAAPAAGSHAHAAPSGHAPPPPATRSGSTPPTSAMPSVGFPNAAATPRVSQAFPSAAGGGSGGPALTSPNASARGSAAPHAAPPPAGSRGVEVVYEGQLSPESPQHEQYITPPPRVGASDPIRDQASAYAYGPTPAAKEPRLARDRSAPLPSLPGPPSADSTTTVETTVARSEQEKNADTVVEGTGRPWGPLVMTLLGLFGSIGFNLYLGWTAWDLYSRYQDAVDDVQELEAKLEAKQQELVTRARPETRRAAMMSGR